MNEGSQIEEAPVSIFHVESSQDVSLASLDKSQISEIELEYEKSIRRNRALLEEVVFILTGRIEQAGVKIHNVEHRVKKLDSVVGKCQRKGITKVSELVDVVGVRVVSLFRSDISLIGKIIQENFEVFDIDDKVADDRGPLGYMSVHYTCAMPSRYIGPRYENTAGIRFEIQVRTLCMHAWAAVSHYLDYKGDWDVPVELKRSLGALSGLFYVADTEFEQFYAARMGSRKLAQELESTTSVTEINFDTVSAFLKRRFADREQVDEESISRFVRELKEASYVSLVDVERDIERGYSAFLKYEKEYPPSTSTKFADLGAARLSLGISSKKYYSILRKNRKGGPDELLKFRKLIKA